MCVFCLVSLLFYKHVGWEQCSWNDWLAFNDVLVLEEEKEEEFHKMQ